MPFFPALACSKNSPACDKKTIVNTFHLKIAVLYPGTVL